MLEAEFSIAQMRMPQTDYWIARIYAQSSTRGMPRGLFGRIDMMARLKHRPNRCLQPQNQTTGISEIAPLPDMLGTCQNRRE
jgi:hypothetical protein